ncbi:MAG: hypothetical protein EAZ16_07180 [Sphingobacteriales bacterium]|nr:MAG: hypothetical protein EAZ16_07180 [Sphingobacteriales bacterium]
MKRCIIILFLFFQYGKAMPQNIDSLLTQLDPIFKGFMITKETTDLVLETKGPYWKDEFDKIYSYQKNKTNYLYGYPLKSIDFKTTPDGKIYWAVLKLKIEEDIFDFFCNELGVPKKSGWTILLPDGNVFGDSVDWFIKDYQINLSIAERGPAADGSITKEYRITIYIPDKYIPKGTRYH